MRVIPPLEITEARLTSSTASEPGVGEALYNNATSYSAGDKVIVGAPSSTVTISIASPGVVTWASNGLPNGTPVVLSTTGALPTGLTAGTIYYVINRAAGSFQLSATPDGAAIVTTGSQSGTHTATAQIHRAYESLTGSNTGNPPAIDSGANWIETGPSNRWAMFDLLRNTATFEASPLTVVLTPGRRVDSVALVGLIADEVEITATSDAVEVYSETINLRTRNVTTWREHFFEPFSSMPSAARFDLPPFTDIVITVTITRASGMVACGGLIIGSQVYLGETQFNAQSDALNFSRIDRDNFGNSVLVQRRTVPKTVQTVWAEKALTNRLRDTRSLLNAIPALWSGLDDSSSAYFEAVLILGVYKQWTIGLDHPNHVVQTLELEEV